MPIRLAYLAPLNFLVMDLFNLFAHCGSSEIIQDFVGVVVPLGFFIKEFEDY